jgi:hypothetical protein
MLLINSLWREQFQGDLGILGKSTTFKGFSHTVIGAMPNSFPLPVVQTLGAGPSARKTREGDESAGFFREQAAALLLSNRY